MKRKDQSYRSLMNMNLEGGPVRQPAGPRTMSITPSARRRMEKRLQNAESDEEIRRVVRDAAKYGVDWSSHLP